MQTEEMYRDRIAEAPLACARRRKATFLSKDVQSENG